MKWHAIVCSQLKPWLRMSSALVVQWHRGDKRGGLSPAVWPVEDQAAGDGSFIAVINTDFRVSGTVTCIMPVDCRKNPLPALVIRSHFTNRI